MGRIGLSLVKCGRMDIDLIGLFVVAFFFFLVYVLLERLWSIHVHMDIWICFSLG